jgi:hypothetical protein
MANSDKDILITPNKGTSSIPEVSFVGQVNSPIKLRVLDDNTLSFEGSAGQLFSINNNLTTGTIFAVSDVSGVPSLSVDASGALKLVPFNGVAMVGGTTTSTSSKLVMVSPNAGTRYSVAIQVNSGINDNQYDGIAWTQGSGGATPLGGIRCLYRNSGQPDFGWYTRSGATTEALRFRLWNSGNLSIGTSDQTDYTRLNVLGGGGITIRADSQSTNNQYIYFRQAPNDYGFRITQDDNQRGQLYFRAVDNGSNTSPLITLDRPSLNVGIGPKWSPSVLPAYRLDIDGDVNFSGNLYQAGSIFKTLPTQNATTDGSVLRTRWNPSTSQFEAYWTHDLDANYRLENPDQWSFRYIINRGYTVAGYQNANPWRNGNRTSHPSDVTISIGDVIDYSAAYIGGSHNGVNLFVYNCANSWLPASAATCSMSMITETNRGLNSSWNDTRARSYSGAWIDFMGNQWRTNGGRNRAYISSGNGNTSRHDLNTEAMIAEIGGTISYVAHAEGEYFCWVSQGQNRFEFSTETYTAWSSYSPAPGCDGINKHQATRIGFFYCSQGGNTDRNVTKRRDSDAVILRSGILKPETGGEENLHTGMNKGYCISNYNYAQNNNAWIYQYYNDVIRFADGTLTYRKGIPGASSGTGQEGGDMQGAGVPPRSYMTYAGGQQAAPGTMVYGGSTGITQQGGAAVADGSGATGGIGTY